MSLNPYELGATPTSPMVRMDPRSGYMEMRGNSLPEDPFSVYTPVLNWLREYAQTPAPKTQLELWLSYYNTSTSKILLLIFEVLEDVMRAGGAVEVRWHYQCDDEDMEDAGHEFSQASLLPFTFVPEKQM